MSMTTRELLERLRRHYIKPGADLPGGIFLPEVGWNNGSGRGGCDAIYVGFTSTSGRILVGHELKVSRSDWLNELNKPGKADAWADECHEWWLVVADPEIVHDGELPAGWGLMSPGRSKTRMTVHVKADRKRDHAPSWLACRSIMARQDTLRARAIAGIRQAAQRDAYRDVEKQVDAKVEQRMRLAPDAEVLRKKLQRIEDALGAQIDWSDSDRPHYGRRGDVVTLDDLEVAAALIRTHGTVDHAVKRFTAGYAVPTEAIRNVLKRFTKELDDLDRQLSALKAAHPDPDQPQQMEIL